MGQNMVWLKIKQEGLRRFWSMFPLFRFDFGTGFWSRSHLNTTSSGLNLNQWVAQG